MLSTLSRPLKNSTFTVTNTTDSNDTSAGDGVCTTGVIGQCSLRAAIQEANALAGADDISFNIPTRIQDTETMMIQTQQVRETRQEEMTIGQ